MKIITLVENTSISKNYKSKHGLCFYIETSEHKILFDLGSNGLFLQNAKKLKVDVSAVDIVVISHGHIDHGGALKQFLKHNNIAKIYINKDAFEKHYTKILGIPIPIGLDESLLSNPQIVLTRDCFEIDNNLMLFSGVKNNDFFPESNQALFAKKNQKLVLDDFSHEQSLIITEKNREFLFSGCAHSGIVNIQKKAESLRGQNMDFIISGMHLFNPTNKKYESDEFVSEIGKSLVKTSARYYTCHCTGEHGLSMLAEELGDRIEYMGTGRILDF